MRLVSLHADTVRALERLRVPFDDLTPEGLWGSPYHLIGLTGEQRGVLEAWHVEVNDVTPSVLTSAQGPQSAANLRTAGAAAVRGRGESRETDAARGGAARDTEVPVPMHEERKTRAGSLAQDAAELVLRGAPLEEAARAGESARAESANSALLPRATRSARAAGFAAPLGSTHNPARLRVSVGGRYREASVQQGKVVLDGKAYDSPAQAAKAVRPVNASRTDWVFWEYFDLDSGKWRILDRDWHP